ncbi:MAG: ATP-dependent RNA helicase RhlE [Chlamydiae bacterium RIFCSPHIGHO2_12_FULL_44_59]|nr:MAG: ATP-dependent RNA helicase RhlE [Chlamydiae bacterium RIFCSPHIGHO2_01_FULL_44_39]OGN57078.1 MAG: ATP-dependent RNA helicase RhlE [Chlamydiae bacterium RIFCSPHIGHO2_02_FULL_45_9]OGN60720.1 MAG: ATP-dependent RNA helicase RhlE [Chlamydiae bacterium RIFCSPHIGHO2_12_FULL_44_59]OGN66980.1 MAG: ATP-dependent RNA helicase RhlE [Chlamydiae bacterium RIFCSPLOWO2_01_FULL_44_52]OGN67532.1 MAG: ATP-dependent RNA helicase RhlE [Chlamydiae bacterium RIFCSPLOWO2_02_FULL_45_22]OGN71234.1 MAG: ATP-depe
MTFDSFGLSREILRAVEEQGYTTPTEIQSQVIPLVLNKRDVLGQAQTGTGKTASFMLPLLHLLDEGQSSYKPRALILTPTRELAAQVHDHARLASKYLRLKSTVVFGGVSIHSQIAKLRKGVDLLVATPGRLLDHVNQRTVDLSSIEYLVFDEADCMLDMGFIHDIRKIIACLPKKRQTLFFSATFSRNIEQLAEDLLHQPKTVQIAQKNAVSDQVKQVVYPVDRSRKPELMCHLITAHGWKQVLVFTRTRWSANRLCDLLNQRDIQSDVIHGDKSQAARSKALMHFKQGRTRILVATDVAARGLDIQQLPHVVNYELPTVASDYVHRIGRTGRAGNQGEAASLVCVDELKLMRDIETLIQKKLDRILLPGYEVDKTIKPDPIRGQRGGPRGGQRREQRPFPSRSKHFQKRRF